MSNAGLSFRLYLLILVITVSLCGFVIPSLTGTHVTITSKQCPNIYCQGSEIALSHVRVISGKAAASDGCCDLRRHANAS